MRRFSQISFSRRSSHLEPTNDPVLTAEDEAFFQKLASEPAPLPNDEISATSPVGEEPKITPLPPSPVEGTPKEQNKENLNPGGDLQDQAKAPESTQELPPVKEKKRRPWSRLWRTSSFARKV